MKPIHKLSRAADDSVEARIERVEEILRSAADFEPETEASYNFAAAAMARRRFHSRAVWLTTAGCACTALLVWWSVPRIVNPINVEFNPPVTVQDDGLNMAVLDSDEGATGTSTQTHFRIADRTPPWVKPKQSPVRLQDAGSPSSVKPDKPAALPAKWETETVDRYASGLLKPSYVEVKNPDGSITRRPAMEVIRLDCGERPAASSGNDMGVVSLANYESQQGEAPK